MVMRADSIPAVGQMAGDAPSLASELQRWMAQEYLKPAEVARNAGLTRHHVSLIARGRIARPNPETIRQLAIGVATHARSGITDEVKRTRALRDFALATGHTDLEADPVHGDLVRVLRTRASNEQVVEFYERLITTCPDISPTLQHLIWALIENFNRPGGDRVMAMLMLLNADDPSAIGELARRIRESDEPSSGPS